MNYSWSEGETHIFIASFDEISNCLADNFSFEVCLRHLSLEAQSSVRSKKQGQAKALVLQLFQKVVLNHALFRAGLAENEALFEELPLETGLFGKPALALPPGRNLHFNASSSNDLMAIAVHFGPQPIGIDLSHERQDAVSPTEFVEQFRGIFARPELARLEAEPSVAKRYVLFNQFWTLKEAFTKFVGCGLNTDLSTFFFDVKAPPRRANVALTKDGEPFAEVAVDWSDEVRVDFAKLEPRFRERISPEPVKCFSAVLRDRGELPVILSVVEQATGPKRVFCVDLARLLGF